MMLAIFAGLGALMLTGSLIEAGVTLPALLGLAACGLAARGFYRLSVRPARRPCRRVGPALRAKKKPVSLRAA